MTKRNRNPTGMQLAAAGAKTRRGRNKQPTMMSTSQDSSYVRYAAIGSAIDATGGSNAGYRAYIAGNGNGLSSVQGPTVVSYYATALFKPGTRIRWEPSVGFTQSGRMFCGFTDNPEVAAGYVAAVTADRLNVVKSLGNVVSFPLYQERDISFPTFTRHKRYDTNSSASLTDVNVLDRSAQQFFLWAVEGATNAAGIGSFWYHDELQVEGLSNLPT